ncbi:MAG: PRC-barrel domain-containing protein [Hyphomicrobium aestuarii]|nr:PRC-barrel domain-containing protein [Hyphomicrobium aestuarii]
MCDPAPSQKSEGIAMLWDASAIKQDRIHATDCLLGTVSDFLVADDSWRVKWLGVDTGGWLPGRKVLIRPRALGHPDVVLRQFPVKLSKQRPHSCLRLDLEVQRHES